MNGYLLLEPSGALTTLPGDWGFLVPYLLAAAVFFLMGAVDPGVASSSGIRVGIHRDLEGRPVHFTLSRGDETVSMDPGKVWVKVDAYKWVTRGLMEEPQSFHIHSHGGVDINGEHVKLTDPDAVAKLELEINKRRTVASLTKPPTDAPAPVAQKTAPAAGRQKVHFRVRVDHLGHLMIEASRGNDRLETGLRGIPNLVVNGFMLEVRNLHVDPLQRAVEIDGTRFPATAEGAAQLEQVLNTRYAPTVRADSEGAVEIKENPASSTGFDIAFVCGHSGLRVEVKGHLNQERLDILQDPARSQILRPDVVLRLSPPNLFIRRKRSDGGEEPIPELPDVRYRQATAAQLRQVFNHPLLRRSAPGATTERIEASSPAKTEIHELRVVRQSQNRMLLWLECLTDPGHPPAGRAFTHHNIADFQHQGLFHPDLDVSLSLDHHTLSILNQKTREERHIQIGVDSADDDLQRAGAMLTAALKQHTPGPLPPGP